MATCKGFANSFVLRVSLRLVSPALTLNMAFFGAAVPSVIGAAMSQDAMRSQQPSAGLKRP